MKKISVLVLFFAFLFLFSGCLSLPLFAMSQAAPTPAPSQEPVIPTTAPAPTQEQIIPTTAPAPTQEQIIPTTAPAPTQEQIIPTTAPAPSYVLSGKYTLVKAIVGEQTVTIDELKNAAGSNLAGLLDMAFEFSGDKVIVHALGTSAEGSYAVHGNILTIMDANGAQSYTYEDDQIFIEQSGTTLVFAKEGSGPAPSQPSGSQEEPEGAYTLTSAIVGGNTFSIDQLKDVLEDNSSMANMLDLSFLFHDGQVDLAYLGITSTQKYTLSGNTLRIQSSATEMVLTYDSALDTLYMEEDGVTLVFTKGGPLPDDKGLLSGTYSLQSAIVGERTVPIEDLKSVFNTDEDMFGMSFTFAGDKVTITAPNYDLNETLSYQLEDSALSIDGLEPLAYANGQILWNQSGVTLVFAKAK